MAAQPIKDRLIHIDLKRIAMDKVLKVSVRVKLMGVPVGVKTHGGILDQVLREVEIECLPSDIPSHIDVDVTNLDLHEVLRVSGLPHSEKIKYLEDEDATVAHVITIREEVAPTAEAGAEATAGAAGTPAEPEVAKKGKTEGEAEAGKKPEGGKK